MLVEGDFSRYYFSRRFSALYCTCTIIVRIIVTYAYDSIQLVVEAN